MKNITKTDGGYTITIDGQDMSVPNDPGNRHFQMVQDAIAGGATVIVPTVPTDADLLATERAGMVVSRFQAKAALMAAGHLPAVETVIAAADAITKLAWAEAVEMRRTSPMIAGLAGAVGLSDTDLDDLFRAAALIEA